jgi:hypothetical protein
MLQRGRQPRLPRESLGAHAGGELGAQHLEDDPASQRAFERDEHTRHPAAAKLSLERVDRT